MNVQRQDSNIIELVDLVHHRWNVPVLAHLQMHSGGKFVSLSNALQVSRASLSASLEDLMAMGLVRKNTGHGHPLRPEYLLTEFGEDIGQHCALLHKTIQRRKAADLAYRKWTLPLVAAMGEEALRFNELKTALTDATPRAITLGLKSMVREKWAARTLIDDYPPATAYALRPKGQQIFSCIAGLFS